MQFFVFTIKSDLSHLILITSNCTIDISDNTIIIDYIEHHSFIWRCPTMPRGKRIEKVYTGKAAKLNDRVKQLEEQLKAAKAERDAAYKEQMKSERKAARNRASDEEKALLKLMRESGKSPAELMEMIKGSSDVQDDGQNYDGN